MTIKASELKKAQQKTIDNEVVPVNVSVLISKIDEKLKLSLTKPMSCSVEHYFESKLDNATDRKIANAVCSHYQSHEYEATFSETTIEKIGGLKDPAILFEIMW